MAPSVVCILSLFLSNRLQIHNQAGEEGEVHVVPHLLPQDGEMFLESIQQLNLHWVIVLQLSHDIHSRAHRKLEVINDSPGWSQQ